jgi:hypothetical protein
VEIATHLLKLREMEKEVSAFMQIHHKKYLEIASQMGSFYCHFGRILTHLNLPQEVSLSPPPNKLYIL